MMQFIESVTLYSINTSKARVIQTAASQFQHLMMEELALQALVADLRTLVDICNSSYSGKSLELHHTPGQISVRYPATGTEQIVVAISYAPVPAHIKSKAQVREEIQRALSRECPEDCARFLVEYTKKGGAI